MCCGFFGPVPNSVDQYLRAHAAAGAGSPSPQDRDFGDDVPVRLRSLITRTMGLRMDAQQNQEIPFGVHVLNGLQKYAKPPRDGAGCCAWFNYAVNTVGHVFRSFLNLITFGYGSNYIDSDWTRLEKRTKYCYMVAVNSRIPGAFASRNPHAAENGRALGKEATRFAHEILAECLDAYTNPTASAEESQFSVAELIVAVRPALQGISHERSL